MFPPRGLFAGLYWSKRGSEQKLAESGRLLRILIRLGNHGAAVDLLAGDDALAAAIELVDEWDVTHGRLEFLEARVAGGVVLDVGHDEFAPAFFGGGAAEDVLHLADGIGEHGVLLAAFFGAGEEAGLHIVEGRGELSGERAL